MKFNEYKLTKSLENDDLLKSLSVAQYYYAIEQKIMELSRTNEILTKDTEDTAGLMCCEVAYVRCRRPFYNVYPAVCKCLENTSLSITLEQLPEPNGETIAMCFAVGHEPKLHNGHVCSMLVEFVGKVVIHGVVQSRRMIRIVLDRFHNSKHCFSEISAIDDGKSLADISVGIGDKRKFISLAVGVIMLASDERFAEPILLNRDQNKQFKTREDYEKAVERASKRGRLGKTIGKGLEISPHMRRPHFAIRWTEKGHSVPKLVPVKGCVVRRMPTYNNLTDDEIVALWQERSSIMEQEKK